MSNEITINIEELLKVEDNSITDFDTIRQIGLLSCTKNDVSKEDRTTLYGKIKKEFRYSALYPYVMKTFDLPPDFVIPSHKMRYLHVYDKHEHRFGFMETLWTNEELSYKWNVLNQFTSNEVSEYSFNTPKEYFIDGSFPCPWEDILPLDPAYPAFSITASEPEETSSIDEESKSERNLWLEWMDITTTDETITKEKAISLIKKYTGLTVNIRENNKSRAI